MENWLPLFVAIFGGIGVKIIETAVSRSGKKIDMEGEIRKELREVVAQQDRKIQELINEVDEWKDKYYQILEKLVGYDQLKTAHEDLKIKLNKLNGHAKALPDK